MTQIPFQPLGLDHVVLWVGPLEEAVDWYMRVLGCTRGFKYPDIAMEHLWFGSILIGLWDKTDPRAAYALPAIDGGTNVDHLGLAVGPINLDTLRDHLTAHGVTIQKELVQGGARGVGQSVYFFDPWGNRIELKGPGQYPDGTA
ncbi:VOC family protein [Shimia ponticola]|uniref:VOC family protein n=1 Tax=Shimia ponticola TaxID=2582893 RepID=UPI0011BF40D1|nr:VOC family protein [Shimia ponticola]